MNIDKSLQQQMPSAKETTIRLLYAFLFTFIYHIALAIVGAIIVFQFGITYITGHCNAKLLEFSGMLNRYVLQILDFLTFRTDRKPYPFDEWPASNP